MAFHFQGQCENKTNLRNYYYFKVSLHSTDFAFINVYSSQERHDLWFRFHNPCTKMTMRKVHGRIMDSQSNICEQPSRHTYNHAITLNNMRLPNAKPEEIKNESLVLEMTMMISINLLKSLQFPGIHRDTCDRNHSPAYHTIALTPRLFFMYG